MAEKDARSQGRGAQKAQSHRLARMRMHGLKPPPGNAAEPRPRAWVGCGWGRLIFANTYPDAESLAEELRQERPGERDIAFYVRDPHVALAAAPQELFLDPSHAYRLDLSTYRPARRGRRGFVVRRLATRRDAEALNTILDACGMNPIAPDFFWSDRDARAIVAFVAEDAESGEILGGVMGVDHARAFDDPESGCSLWCLAVDPQAPHRGLGETLVRHVAEHFASRGASFLDLSVMHDNTQAIALYDKLGFRRVPVFTIKRKNTINEKLYIGQPPEAALNPYARIIVDEARRRGIGVEILDAEGGFFRLRHGGRAVRCRESLSEFTSAVAMSICDDKTVTRRMVEAAGVRVPAQMIGGDAPARAAFLAEQGAVVVKPARGEQGRGVAVGLTEPGEMEAAVAAARALCPDVLVEQFFEGEDLRLIVIDGRVVAAALRRPARVVGDGRSTIRALIESQSRRRAAATGGESRIPLDAETERCLRAGGFGLEDVAREGAEIAVRRTANLHTGGTIHDVTGETHPVLIDAAIAAARAIDIPVTGIDLMVKSPREPEYVFIEANERPGLANHEPQPTAERFIDLLFPLSMPEAARQARQRLPVTPRR
ncbi:N-acetylglutaminylglutamine synthetase [Rubrimonas cliftonensis]|uniref:GNAT-family acetyltransferase TIGR03103 n=1 Tax=Rubrimonas cliftonensis TaxID=89524 RepID=A0A1H4D2P5_9RHOB|nr:N-acetylglutaminylglutamine synthetase [Rubrimonas cliftonensis]SEA67053.1 GNAT-family acetyltransferase TIGR03103 [Rubrimonas cliftonensis]